jgi:hypothetical protein
MGGNNFSAAAEKIIFHTLPFLQGKRGLGV